MCYFVLLVVKYTIVLLFILRYTAPRVYKITHTKS